MRRLKVRPQKLLFQNNLLRTTTTMLCRELSQQWEWGWRACKSVKEFNRVLSRLVVNGVVPSLLYHLVHFLCVTSNIRFRLEFNHYARMLVEHYGGVSSSSSTQTFFWNTIIKAYATRAQFGEQTFLIYSRMLHNSCKPDNYTFPFLVKAASSSSSVPLGGQQVHAQIVINGFQANVFVVNTLLNMYSLSQDMESAFKLFHSSTPTSLDIVSWNTLIDGYIKSGDLHMARHFFDKMPHRNQISWTAIISGYANTGELDVAQSLFDKMPNTVTCNSMISGFAKSGFLPLARKLFDEMPERNIVSWNSIISAYARCGEIDSARSLFDSMPERDVFSWSCMISGYAQHHRGEDALKLFKEMLNGGKIRPNEVTLISILSVCGHLAALNQGKWIHSYIKRNGLKLGHNLGAALIDMYAKCGCLDTAVQIFWSLVDRNTSTWNALITGLAIHGAANKALRIFAEMQRLKKKPNSITFLAVLMACCHGGLVEEGREHFKSMLNIYGVQPEMKHYGCMIDLLGRAGLLEEAEEVVQSMPMEPDVRVLGALLGACRIHQNVEVTDRLCRGFLEFNSSKAGCHILLSNIYAAAGRWVDASSMRGILEIKQIRKEAGFSSLE